MCHQAVFPFYVGANGAVESEGAEQGIQDRQLST